jgi:predicted SAM-dependent methyltransferase
LFLYKMLKQGWQLNKLRRKIRTASPLKVVIGAGPTQYNGWVSTDIETLDITVPASWARLFGRNSIDRLLAEHVFEHLSETECLVALRTSYLHLKPGGMFRIAVPDGYRKDVNYLAEVAPPKDGHQILFTLDKLVDLLHQAGYKTNALEYFDSDGKFHFSEWDQEDGFVQRSFRFDTQENFRHGDLRYTSLIVDGVKV